MRQEGQSRNSSSSVLRSAPTDTRRAVFDVELDLLLAQKLRELGAFLDVFVRPKL